MTRQLISTARQPPLHYLTRSVRRTSGFVLAESYLVSRLEWNATLITSAETALFRSWSP